MQAEDKQGRRRGAEISSERGACGKAERMGRTRSKDRHRRSGVKRI